MIPKYVLTIDLNNKPTGSYIEHAFIIDPWALT